MRRRLIASLQTEMSAVVTAVFKATVGLLLTKGRDCLAKKLQEGDVTDEQFRSMIVRELDDIKSNLDGLARKDLLTSISFFSEGLVFLYKVLDNKYYANCEPESSKVKTRNETTEKDKSTERLDLSTAHLKTVSLLVEGEEPLYAELDESGKRALADAKKRFDEARMKATEAFNNVALSTKDRILAMQYRVMSTILEKIDSPAEAIATCKLCLKELHAMPAVVKSFEIKLSGGFWSMFKKDERNDLINSVQAVNRVVARVLTAIDGVLSKEFDNWPPVTEKKICLLKDKVETWSFSFGHERKGNQKLDRLPQSIATNTQGDFIITERSFLDRSTIKVFNQDGKLWKLLHDDSWSIVQVVTDHLDNIYVLNRSHVNVIYSQPLKRQLKHRKFFLHECSKFEGLSLTVNKKKDIFALVKPYKTDRGYYDSAADSIVQVYHENGQFKYTFGDKEGWECIIAVDDGFISQRRSPPAGIDLLDALGKCRRRILLPVGVMAVHFRTKHLITAQSCSNTLQITVHQTNGDFVRTIFVKKNGTVFMYGMAVTPEGRIAVLCTTTEYSEDEETRQSVVHVL